PSETTNNVNQQDGAERESNVGNNVWLTFNCQESDTNANQQNHTDKFHRNHEKAHLGGRFPMLWIRLLGCLVWCSMFRAHVPSFHPSGSRMLYLHGSALPLLAKGLEDTNQAIFSENCPTHTALGHYITAVSTNPIQYDLPHQCVMLQHHTHTLRSSDMSSHTPTTQPRKEGTALSRAMRPVNHVVERFIPSSLVFSILLTFIVVILALILTDTAPGDLVVYWGDGLAGLLDFITQMALILLLGHILANTGPVRHGLSFLGS